ncbi:hypothetical protein MNBD_NITROSPINAE03-1342 [hydrothermal vent metagenome]|uniref:Methyltransferase type 11 domain-containing protein n=1 Tax=hydrothermal vent metagenome TaxID=652676 RepID=A0A3B1CDP8_9ZZZZ
MTFKLRLLLLLYTNPSRLFDKIHNTAWCVEMFNDWIDHLKISSGKSVIDVGCGPGGLTRNLLSRGVDAVGMDKSERMLKVARKNAGEDSGACFINGDVYNMDFEDGRFDFALSASLINIVNDPLKAAVEMKRIVKTDGRVCFLAPGEMMTRKAANRYAMDKRSPKLDRELLELWADKAPSMQEQRLRSLADEAGLNDIKVSMLLDGMVVTLSGRKR